MAIRIRKVGATLVALCAAETDAIEGDIYLDDSAHYALAAKFAQDWQGQIVDWKYEEYWTAMQSQKLRDAKEELQKWLDMIYTIGHTESYERGFRETPELMIKVGRTQDYQGGIVFQTKEEVTEFLKRENVEIEGRQIPSTEFSVYGVLADWDKDVENGHLIRDVKLVQL